MNFPKMGLAISISFILGTMVAQTPSRNANPQASGLAHVSIVPVFMFDAKTPASQDLPGARIAGISCLPKPEKRTPDSAVCYVATALN